MVMEHFAGGSVAGRLRSGRTIPRPVALRWLREAADALDCAHRHDVVHRDVKPANLLLDERGRLAVGDFGIATVATEASITQTGQVLGTAAYISPEQARGEAATAASDRYALAVVAFELLTGRKPFDAHHPTAQARAHVEAAVPSASAAATGLPGAVDRVLRFGMAKEPDRRPSTATDFLDRLEEALEVADVPPPEPPTIVAAAIPTPAAPRRRWPGVAALAALAVVAGSAIAIATGAGTGGDGGGSTSTTHSASASQDQATTHAAKPKPKAAKPKAQKTTTHATTTQQTPPPSGSSDPVALNNEGFALIQQGQAAAAVPSLQRSVDAFRAQGRTAQIDYAYALYNLGNALRLSGRPADAIPYLEERLRISNYKRGVVKQELKTARRLAKSD
jgi:serine/threonine protein kinase